MKLEDKFRERLLGHLSDANTEVDVKIAVEVCKDFAISFSLFCAENYVHLNDNDWMHYTDFEDKEFKTEELLEIYLNQE